MILVDSSVWIDHLRVADDVLVAALGDGTVLAHPYVLGELACGSLKDRGKVLTFLGKLPMASIATDVEARAFIEQHALMGRGVGYLDIHLLASVTLERDAKLWTRDRRLNDIAQRLGLAHAGLH